MPDQVTASNSHAVLIAQIADLRAQLAEAREALRPFAEGYIDVSWTAVILGVDARNALKVARAALSRKES